jgi:hypothetical protein
MCGAARARILGPMESSTITIRLELRYEDGCLRGRAENGDGPPREFTGWIGLLAAIDELSGGERITTNPKEDL